MSWCTLTDSRKQRVMMGRRKKLTGQIADLQLITLINNKTLNICYTCSFMLVHLSLMATSCFYKCAGVNSVFCTAYWSMTQVCQVLSLFMFYQLEAGASSCRFFYVSCYYFVVCNISVALPMRNIVHSFLKVPCHGSAFFAPPCQLVSQLFRIFPVLVAVEVQTNCRPFVIAVDTPVEGSLSHEGIYMVAEGFTGIAHCKVLHLVLGTTICAKA